MPRTASDPPMSEYTAATGRTGHAVCVFCPRGLPEGVVRGLHLGNPEEERVPADEEGERGLKETVLKSPAHIPSKTFPTPSRCAPSYLRGSIRPPPPGFRRDGTRDIGFCCTGGLGYRITLRDAF